MFQVDLDEMMDNFFNTLYQKMFTVLNSQYSFDEKYLECVGMHMKEMRPFGDVPSKLGNQVKRSFVATRAFSQALTVASDVLKHMQQVSLCKKNYFETQMWQLIHQKEFLPGMSKELITENKPGTVALLITALFINCKNFIYYIFFHLLNSWNLKSRFELNYLILFINNYLFVRFFMFLQKLDVKNCIALKFRNLNIFSHLTLELKGF